MFRLIRLFFTLFGVVSFIFWVGLGYGWASDAYGVRKSATAIVNIMRTSMSGEDTSQAGVSEQNDSNQEADSFIAPEQQVVLDSVGISANAIPTSLTAKQQQCLQEKIGEERVSAISAGATPTPKEVLAGASCL